jgi:hypothetical protein
LQKSIRSSGKYFQQLKVWSFFSTKF